MARDQDERFVIWPGYFDLNATRGSGRRLRKDLCISSPRAEDIFHVCRKLGFSPELQDDKRHPNSTGTGTGRVMVRKSKNKSKMMVDIATALLRNRK